MALKTYDEIFTFINVAAAWLHGEQQQAGDRKLTYALKKVLKAGMKIHADYAERLEDLNIKHCAVDANGIILREKDGPYSFTREGLQALRAAHKAYVEMPVDITSFVVPDVAATMTPAVREAFAGFVLPEIVDDDASDAPGPASSDEEAAEAACAEFFQRVG